MLRIVAPWAVFVVAVAVPIITVGYSPLLAWRDPIYITGGFAGIVAMVIMLLQPLLVAGYLPGVSKYRGRRTHRWTGALLTLFAALHVFCLWVTSPPDMIDALLFVSPTPFSAWGVIAMWAIFGSALLAILRRPLRLRWRTWRRAHMSLVFVAVVSSIVHALQIEGTMMVVPKFILCGLVVMALLGALYRLNSKPT